MMTACVVLLVMWRGQPLSSGTWLLLPLALCLGMHFLMHHQRTEKWAWLGSVRQAAASPEDIAALRSRSRQ